MRLAMILSTALPLLSRAALLCFALAPAWGGDVMTSAPLLWRPTSTVQELGLPPINLMQFEGTRIALLPFTDTRADKTQIGENQEKAAFRPVTTKDDVAAFVAGHTKEILAGLGLPLTSNATEATITLAGEILNYGVVEKDMYMGDVRLKFTVRKGEKRLWAGLAMGTSKRWGRSFKLENYHETLSDALLDAVAHLCKDPEFIKNLAGK